MFIRIKTIVEIKDLVAIKRGFKNWEALVFGTLLLSSERYLNELTDEIARQSCDEQIKACAIFERKYSNQKILKTSNIITSI